MMSWNGLHKFADIIFRIIQKTLYITSSNLVRYVTNKRTSQNLFCKLVVTSSRVLLFLITLSIKRDLFKSKNEDNFFIILFKIISFFIEFLACNGFFGLFTKIKKESGTSFWCIFFAWFSHKNVPYLILYR